MLPIGFRIVLIAGGLIGLFQFGGDVLLYRRYETDPAVDERRRRGWRAYLGSSRLAATIAAAALIIGIVDLIVALLR